MTKIFLSFEAESEDELLQLVLNYAIKQKKPPSWLGQTPPPSDPELMEDAATLSDEEYDAKHDPHNPRRDNGADPEPVPAPKPKRGPRKLAELTGGSKRKLPLDDGGEIEMAVVTEYKPEPAPPPVDLPPLDTLKAVVTNAVRLEQKGEGSHKILHLLAGFKDATGLAFVMNAEDRHKQALFDLVRAAGLPVV